VRVSPTQPFVTFGGPAADVCEQVPGGTDNRVHELLGPGTTDLTMQVRSTDLSGRSPADRVTFNRTYVGPTQAIFDRLGPAEQDALAGELAACVQQFNRTTDGTLVATAEYLQITATRAA